MNRSRLLFIFSLFNLVAVFVCVFFLANNVVFKFNAYFQVTDFASRWVNIILPILQVVSCMIIMIVDIRENGSIPHIYRYIVAYIAVSVATFYTWIMIVIQFGNYSIGDKIVFPITSLILIPIALAILVYTYYQSTKPYKTFSIFGYAWVRNSPIAWQKTHTSAGRNGMLSSILIIVCAVVNDIVYKSNWAYVIALGIWLIVYYLFTFIHSLSISHYYNDN